MQHREMVEYSITPGDEDGEEGDEVERDEKPKPRTPASNKNNSHSLEPLIFRIAYGHGVGPHLLRRSLLESGMVEFNESIHLESQWDLWWKGFRFREEEINFLLPSQRINHHPSPVGRQSDIIKKDGLLRAIRRMCATYPRCASLLSFPTSFHLPREEHKFVEMFYQNVRNSRNKKNIPYQDNADESITLSVDTNLGGTIVGHRNPKTDQPMQSNIWILKPAEQSRGRGIYLFNQLEELCYLSKSVVQRYITDPLLIGGYKFDLRIYVVVPSYSPFIAYVYADGLVRFATERFDLDDLKNVFSHLTNSSINVNGPCYMMNKSGIGRGCKWGLRQFREWLTTQTMNDRYLWARVKALIILTLVSQAASVPKVSNAYEVFGFDILIDSKLRPWLIEVNANPSLSVDCGVDEVIKKPLIQSVLQMVRMDRPRSATSSSWDSDSLLFSVRQPTRPKPVRTRCTRVVLTHNTQQTCSNRYIDNNNTHRAGNRANCSFPPLVRKPNIQEMPDEMKRTTNQDMSKNEPRPIDLMPYSTIFQQVLRETLQDQKFEENFNPCNTNSVTATAAITTNHRRRARLRHLLFPPPSDEHSSRFAVHVPHSTYSRGIGSTSLFQFQQAFAHHAPGMYGKSPSYSACPLYGPGSERLLPQLHQLAKQFIHLIEPNKSVLPSTNNTTAKSSSAAQIRHPSSSSSSITNKGTNNAPRKASVAELNLSKNTMMHTKTRDLFPEEYRIGSQIIPQAFGQLKLLFPFNLITRIACARETGGYPDSRIIVQQVARLVQYYSSTLNRDPEEKDFSVIDIPEFWCDDIRHAKGEEI